MIIDRVRFIFTRVNDNLTFFYKGNSYNDFDNILNNCNWLSNCIFLTINWSSKQKCYKRNFF